MPPTTQPVSPTLDPERNPNHDPNSIPDPNLNPDLNPSLDPNHDSDLGCNSNYGILSWVGGWGNEFLLGVILTPYPPLPVQKRKSIYS